MRSWSKDTWFKVFKVTTELVYWTIGIAISLLLGGVLYILLTDLIRVSVPGAYIPRAPTPWVVKVGMAAIVWHFGFQVASIVLSFAIRPFIRMPFQQLRRAWMRNGTIYQLRCDIEDTRYKI